MQFLFILFFGGGSGTRTRKESAAHSRVDGGGPKVRRHARPGHPRIRARSQRRAGRRQVSSAGPGALRGRTGPAGPTSSTAGTTVAAAAAAAAASARGKVRRGPARLGEGAGGRVRGAVEEHGNGGRTRFGRWETPNGGGGGGSSGEARRDCAGRRRRVVHVPRPLQLLDARGGLGLAAKGGHRNVVHQPYARVRGHVAAEVGERPQRVASDLAARGRGQGPWAVSSASPATRARFTHRHRRMGHRRWVASQNEGAPVVSGVCKRLDEGSLEGPRR